MSHDLAQFALKQNETEYRDGLVELFPEEQFEPGELDGVPVRSVVPIRYGVHVTLRISGELEQRVIAIAERYNMVKTEVFRRLLSKSVEEFPGQFVDYRLPLVQAVSPKPHG